MPEVLTPEQLRALDGPALCKLAWELGLAPEESTVYETHYGAHILLWGDFECRWEPHKDIDTASAIFRSLRARGWGTDQHWYPSNNGVVCAWKNYPECPGYRHVEHEVYYGEGREYQEAHALTLCAVLAVASTTQGAP